MKTKVLAVLKEMVNVLNTPVFEIKIGEKEPEPIQEEVNAKADELAAKVEMLQRKFNGELFA
jgi:hypothetical protein